MTYIKDVLESIIGTYSPNDTLEGIAQIDWVWIASAVMLIALMITFFKVIRFVIGGFKK